MRESLGTNSNYIIAWCRPTGVEYLLVTQEVGRGPLKRSKSRSIRSVQHEFLFNTFGDQMLSRIAVDQRRSRDAAREEKCWEKYDWLLIVRSSIISSLTWTNMISCWLKVHCHVRQTMKRVFHLLLLIDLFSIGLPFATWETNGRSWKKTNKGRAREGEREQRKRNVPMCVLSRWTCRFSLLAKGCWLDLTNEFQRYD